MLGLAITHLVHEVDADRLRVAARRTAERPAAATGGRRLRVQQRDAATPLGRLPEREPLP